jgi:hypothetical protein
MSKMFMSTIRSLQRQRDEADIFARGREITSYNMMEQRDRLAEQKEEAEKRNMQLELENEVAMELLQCSNCREFRKGGRYVYADCGHSICIELFVPNVIEGPGREQRLQSNCLELRISSA